MLLHGLGPFSQAFHLAIVVNDNEHNCVRVRKIVGVENEKYGTHTLWLFRSMEIHNLIVLQIAAPVDFQILHLEIESEE